MAKQKAAKVSAVQKRKPAAKKKSLWWIWLILLFVILLLILLWFLWNSGGKGTAHNCNDAKDPVVVMSCLQQFCDFDTKQCEVSCPFGFEMDEKGCPFSCGCAEKGTYEGDLGFGDQSIPRMLQYYESEIGSKISRGFSIENQMKDVNFWKDNIKNGRYQIPYKFHHSLSTKSMRSFVEESMKVITDQTCIDFNPWEDEKEYITFVDEKTCWSGIGKDENGQTISLGGLCKNERTVVHELMHALGFMHEQSRPDRDNYVKIHWDNINQDNWIHFKKKSNKWINSIEYPYDVSSIMHFNSYSYAIERNRPTITDLKTGLAIDTKNSILSKMDVVKLKTLYNCPKSANEASEWGQWSDWTNPDITCGNATVLRFRKCLSESSQPIGGCTGLGHEIKEIALVETCNENVGRWTSFGFWSECSRTCGAGISWRQRNCENGTTCHGEHYQSRNCQRMKCPSAALWGQWTSWTKCSKSCDSGTQVSERYCYSSNERVSFGCEEGGRRNKQAQYKVCNAHACGAAAIELFSSEDQREIKKLTFHGTNFSAIMCESGDGYYSFGDFNGDGIDDVLCSYQYFIQPDNHPNLTWKGQMVGCEDPNQRFIRDINGDRKPDFLCHNKAIRKITAYLLNDQGTFNGSLAIHLGDLCHGGRIVPANLNLNSSEVNFVCQFNSQLILFENIT